LRVEVARPLEVAPCGGGVADLRERRAAVVEKAGFPGGVAVPPQNAQCVRRGGPRLSGSAREVEDGDPEDLSPRAVDPGEGSLRNLDLRDCLLGLPAISEIERDVAARESCSANLSGALARAYGCPHRSEGSRVAEPVAREAKRMKRSDPSLGVAARSGERKSLLRQCARLARFGLDECVGALGELEGFRPRRTRHMLFACIKPRGRCSSKTRENVDEGAFAMDGNKPTATFGSAFTERLAAHRELAYYPYPDALCPALVLFVIDQLLVGQAALQNPAVKAELEVHAEDTNETVFDEGDTPNENVAIWRLKNVTGAGANPDVAEFVWDFRVFLALHGVGPEQVAPNHVLIAAPNFHDCPYGPPEEHERLQLDPQVPSVVNVAVIDSGYLSSGPMVAPRVSTTDFGKWLERLPVGSAKPWKWTDGTEVAGPTLDALDQNDDKLLDALAGHANFVAGVIAQACPEARITIESHNAAFVESDAGNPAIATEASVARSLWHQRDNDVINVGFAFPTLPDIPLTGTEAITAGPPSWALEVALTSFIDRPAHFVVAPAGNQNCTVPQYPAAFGEKYHNVIGVGSVDADGNRSSFSNHGPWVRCCTEGEDVVSTFISASDVQTEEEEPEGATDAGTRPVKSFDGWATWSGTSFAAPKVAAELARRKAEGVTLVGAWNGLVAGMPTTWQEMGVLLRELPPH
jgi:hypothetical protein